jgi:hypothetical protein
MPAFEDQLDTLPCCKRILTSVNSAAGIDDAKIHNRARLGDPELEGETMP